MGQKILVIGSTNIDLVVPVDHTPEVGETILGGVLKKVPGGKGANQAVACGRLGGKTTFLTAVGADGLGEKALSNMAQAGVDISRVRRSEAMDTGMAMICVNREGNNSIVVVPGANTLCDLTYIRQHEEQIRTADILLAQLETPADAVYYALERGKALGKITMLNPAPAPEEIPEEVYRGLTYLTPNETELSRLTKLPVDSLEEVERAAAALLDKGVEHVIVTIGKRGAMLCSRAGAKVFPPPYIKVADTTAAGDTFNGAVAVKLAEGADVEEAIPFANAASTLSVSRPGAQTSIPSREEVERFLAQIKEGETV